jgi:formate dehydrogenase major subunit
MISGATAVGLAVARVGFDLTPKIAHAKALKTDNTKKTTSICPYCALGCGIIVSTSQNGDGRVVNIEGDPEHIINQGTLCSKGASLAQLTENSLRVTEPLYRAPYSKTWQKVSWDWALMQIARRIKATREASFELKNDRNDAVNRTTAIASVGSAALDNEECWIYQALLRSLGLVYIEHQARI